MEFIVGAFVGVALTWWVFATWIMPKSRLKFTSKCEWTNCNLTLDSSDYDVLAYVVNAHQRWHHEQLLDNNINGDN